jgi:FdhD protein
VTNLLKTPITRLDVKSGRATKMSDLVAEEKPLHIFINGKHYATIFCSPSDLKEMVIGHLLSEGMLKSLEEIKDLNLSVSDAICRVRLEPSVNVRKRQILSRLSYRVISSACGSLSVSQFPTRIPKVKSTTTVRAETVLECVNRLDSTAYVFRKTGGVHAAAIYSKDGDRKALAEDVGRHNAVDKVIGAGVLNQLDFGTCFLTLSGRMTGDIVFKAARIGLPIIASLAAAIGSGITMAQNVGVTLVGFARGNRMNVYTFPKRILLSN